LTNEYFSQILTVYRRQLRIPRPITVAFNIIDEAAPTLSGSKKMGTISWHFMSALTA